MHSLTISYAQYIVTTIMKFKTHAIMLLNSTMVRFFKHTWFLTLPQCNVKLSLQCLIMSSVGNLTSSTGADFVLPHSGNPPEKTASYDLPFIADLLKTLLFSSRICMS